MATQHPTLSKLPSISNVTPSTISPKTLLPNPKTSSISLSPSNDKKQKHINKCLHNTINNNTNKHKNISLITYNIDTEEKKENITDNNYNLSTSNIYDLHKQTNTNNLTWSNIINNYNFTGQEISGAKQLQLTLSKLYNITSLINDYFPPFECIRYYCGCSMDLERAITKWKYSIKMYKQYGMDKITDIEIIECFKILSKSIAFGGYDNDGCRIITIKYSLFHFNEYKSIDIFLYAGFYLFYYLTHDIKAHRNGVALLCDLKGFSLSNFSFTVEKNGLYFAQKVLPMRIKKVFVIDAPWIANGALKLVKPLLNEKLRKRVFVIKHHQVYNELNKNDLPMLIGGRFDEKYLNNNNNQSMLYDALVYYFKNTINLNHFEKLMDEKYIEDSH